MNQPGLDRRSLLIASMLMTAVAGCKSETQRPGVNATSSPPLHSPDPNETFVLPYRQMAFTAWSNLPPHSGEMATLYGNPDKPGPYLVLMKWNPGWFSAPHSYAFDRICVVVFGTWWVNSGRDFLPQNAVPVTAGGYVKRTARTPHYDGVPRGHTDPAVIAIFGLGPGRATGGSHKIILASGVISGCVDARVRYQVHCHISTRLIP